MNRAYLIADIEGFLGCKWNDTYTYLKVSYDEKLKNGVGRKKSFLVLINKEKEDRIPFMRKGRTIFVDGYLGEPQYIDVDKRSYVTINPSSLIFPDGNNEQLF